jgi:hypothetical protein
MKEMRQKMVQPLMDGALVPSMAYAYGGGKLGRKIAAYVLAVQRGDTDAKLDVSPADTFDEDPPRKPKPLKAVKRAKKSTEAKPKPLAHKKMQPPPQAGSILPHSDELKATQSDFLSQTIKGNHLPQPDTNDGHSCVDS